MNVLTLSPLDFAVVGGFIVLLLGLGFSAKLRENSVFQMLTAGRQLTLPAFVASLVSTWYGGILGMGESVSYFGLGTWALLGLPYYVFAGIYAAVFARRARELPQITLPEMLTARFGRGMGLVGAGLIYLLAVPAAHVLMLGVLLSAITGWALAPAVIAATVVASFLLIKGGLLADVRLSIPAFVMMYVGFAAMVVWCVTQHPPATAFVELRKQPLWSFDGGQGIVPLITFFILGAWTLVDPGFHQRVASAESPETGRKGVWISVLCWMVFDALTITTGLYALALNVNQGLENPLLIFPAMAQQVLPAGMKGLFLCGMIGTIASAMVGYALVSGGTFGRELVARFKPGVDDHAVRRWTYAGIVLSCAAAVAVALSVTSVVSLWYAWSGAVVGALLLPVASAYGVIKLRADGIAAAWITGVAATVSLGWMTYGLRTGNPFLNVQIGELTVGLGTLIPGLAVSALGFGIAGALKASR